MIIDINETCDKKIVLGLGYFEAVHLGHQKIFDKIIDVADKLQAETCIFTFDKNPGCIFGGDDKSIFTIDERLDIYKKFNIKNVILAPASKEFLEISACDFIEKLLKNFKISAIVVGEDYTYGKDKKGNINTLIMHLLASKVKLYVEELKTYENKKFSSSDVRNLILSGDVETINKILGFNYFVSGNVIKGRGDGNIIKYPTANIDFDKNKLLLKNGVYVTEISCDEKTYKAITNVGTHPTFNDFHSNIESHILNFNGNLYGKKIKVAFVKKIRDIIKFDNKQDLIEQLGRDIKVALEVFND